MKSCSVTGERVGVGRVETEDGEDSDTASVERDCTACKIERTESNQRQIGQGEAEQRKIIGAVDVDQPIGCNGIM